MRSTGNQGSGVLSSMVRANGGGVSPLAHATPPVTLIDRDLLRFDVVWAAAGHPHSVFPLHPNDLARLTGAPVVDVVQEPAPPAAA